MGRGKHKIESLGPQNSAEAKIAKFAGAALSLVIARSAATRQSIFGWLQLDGLPRRLRLLAMTKGARLARTKVARLAGSWFLLQRGNRVADGDAFHQTAFLIREIGSRM